MDPITIGMLSASVIAGLGGAIGGAMAREPGRVFTRSQLLDAIHGVAFESYERAIDAHVKNLRRKIEPDPREPRFILKVYGVGYRFTDCGLRIADCGLEQR